MIRMHFGSECFCGLTCILLGEESLGALHILGPNQRKATIRPGTVLVLCSLHDDGAGWVGLLCSFLRPSQENAPAKQKVLPGPEAPYVTHAQ